MGEMLYSDGRAGRDRYIKWNGQRASLRGSDINLSWDLKYEIWVSDFKIQGKNIPARDRASDSKTQAGIIMMGLI